ncbi:MAG: hypothetical protein WD069_16770 [Planctomycetales bacterium]
MSRDWRREPFLWRGPFALIFVISQVLCAAASSTLIVLGGTPEPHENPSDPFLLRSHQFITEVSEGTWIVAGYNELLLYTSFVVVFASVMLLLAGNAHGWRVVVNGRNYGFTVAIVVPMAVVSILISCAFAP